MAGNYKVPDVYVNVKAVFTNTVPVDAYRGAGRPEATFQLERVIDKAARELGMDPVELRRKNFITRVSLPDAGGGGIRHRRLRRDDGQGAEIADSTGFEARAAESAGAGKLRGWA
jgi:carbon-monoxide dehydrogenase large subunit